MCAACPVVVPRNPYPVPAPAVVGHNPPRIRADGGARLQAAHLSVYEGDRVRPIQAATDGIGSLVVVLAQLTTQVQDQPCDIGVERVGCPSERMRGAEHLGRCPGGDSLAWRCVWGEST